jgi:hypothetical protein
MKVGRNDLCPCGSGKKFKKCHLAVPPGLWIPPSARPIPKPPRPLPDHIRQEFEQGRFKEQQRVNAFGNIRPIIHFKHPNGTHFVGVRNRFYHSDKWQFFTDFLLEYGFERFGKEWLEKQQRADLVNQHPMFVWRRQAYDFMNSQPRRVDGTFAATPNGPLAACNSFYYDLYTVDDNSILDESLLERLRNPDQFQGALHEVFVAATCLRAGFSIVPENERNPTGKHVEFIAIHNATQQHVLVEAKSRHRAGVLAMSGQRNDNPDIRFGSLINAAIAKDPTNPLAILVDTNLPMSRAKPFYRPVSTDPIVMSKAMTALVQKIRANYGGVDPYNLLVFSNHPQHYSDDHSMAQGSHWAAIISRKPRVPVYREDALNEILKAVNLYGNVPTLFPPEQDPQ